MLPRIPLSITLTLFCMIFGICACNGLEDLDSIAFQGENSTTSTGGDTSTSTSSTSSTSGTGESVCGETEAICDGECVAINTVTDCGDCGVDCAIIAPENAVSDACTDQGDEEEAVYLCTYTCADGFYDLDGDLNDVDNLDPNGCEYACTPSTEPDEICDGIDNDCDGTIDINADENAIAESCSGGLPANAEFDACAEGACVYRCIAGFSDLDSDLNEGDDGNGCETACEITNNGEEICDGLDNDCSGEVDDGCDDDGDGFCDIDREYVLFNDEAPPICPNGPGDCNDVPTQGGLNINPNALEICDGLDNNCSGEADDASVTVLCSQEEPPENSEFVACVANEEEPLCQSECFTGFVDLDGDPVNGCECRLTNNGTESCDGVDNNCDGFIDEGCDDDGDGFCDIGLAYNPTEGGFLAVCPNGPGDCNDDPDTRGADIYPNAPEICNNLNESCNNDTIDEGCDDDRDGFCDIDLIYAPPNGGLVNACPNGPEDCNDTALIGAEIYPGATEVCNNVDDSCNGTTDEGCDDDGDGFCDAALRLGLFGSLACPNGGDDCNDEPNSGENINPGAVDYCDDANIDEDCSGDQAGCCGIARAVILAPDSITRSRVRVASSINLATSETTTFILAHEGTPNVNGYGPSGPVLTYFDRGLANLTFEESLIELDMAQHADLTLPTPFDDSNVTVDFVASRVEENQLESVPLYTTYFSSFDTTYNEELAPEPQGVRRRQPSLTRTESFDTVIAFSEEQGGAIAPTISLTHRVADEPRLSSMRSIPIHTTSCEFFELDACPDSTYQIKIHSPTYAHAALENDRLYGLVSWGVSTTDRDNTEGYIQWSVIDSSSARSPRTHRDEQQIGNRLIIPVEPNPQSTHLNVLNGRVGNYYILAFFNTSDQLTVLWLTEDGEVAGQAIAREVNPSSTDSLRIAPRYDELGTSIGAWLVWSDRNEELATDMLRMVEISSTPPEENFVDLATNPSVRDVYLDDAPALASHQPVDIDSTPHGASVAFINRNNVLGLIYFDTKGRPQCP